MESFYDKEAGVAWGPITKEEMLDDILLYKSMNVEKRMTLSCPPTFSHKCQRRDEITQQNLGSEESEINVFSNKNHSKDLIVISSDDEEEKETFQPDFQDSSSQSFSCENNVDNVCNKNEICDSTTEAKSPDCSKICIKEDSIEENYVNNQEIQYTNVRNRLPTPANLEDTCDEICVSDYERDKSTSEIVERLPTLWDENQYDQSSNNPDGSQTQEEKDQDYKPSVSPDEAEQREIRSETCNNTASKENSLLSLIERRSFCDLDDVEQPENLYTTFNSGDGNEELDEHGVKEKSFKIPIVVNEESYEGHGYFNDTLEEIEKLLSEGVDYSMSTDNAKGDTEKSFVRDKSCQGNEPKTPMSNVKQNFAMNSNSSPSYLKKRAVSKKSIKTDTKAPRIPVPIRQNQKKLFPKPMEKYLTDPTSLVTVKNRFKDIESPISIYIKNSGKTPLYKKVTPSKPISCDKIRVQARSLEKINKENGLVFPEVIYKPAKNAIITKDKGIKLPNKIDLLISHKPNVIKHQGRIGTAIKKDSVSRKLLEEDLTIDSSISLNTTEDISIRFAKKAYIT